MEQKSKRAEGGFSLIEVIVGLLILSVIIVPLLRSFIVAQTSNAQARIMQYANTVAENLMEEIKAGNYPMPAITPEADGTYVRTLSGESILTEGTATFTAVVRYNPTAYEHGEGLDGVPIEVNEYQPPEIIPVDGAGTASIFLDLEDADRLALDTFIDRNMSAVDSYNASIDFGESPMLSPLLYDETLSVLGKYAEVDDGYSALSSHLNRKLTVTVEELDGGKLQVGCTAEYSLKNSAVYLGVYPVAETIQVFASEPFAKDALKHVYLFYRPLYGVSELTAADGITLDLRLHGNGALTSEDSLLNVFVVVRDGITSNVSENMFCSILVPEAYRLDAFKKLLVYGSSKLDLTVNGGSLYPEEERVNQSGVLIPQADAETRLCDVTVQIFHDGRQITSLDGSILN